MVWSRGTAHHKIELSALAYLKHIGDDVAVDRKLHVFARV